MNEINDGGPAFPRQLVQPLNSIDFEEHELRAQDGMPLRDYFAAKAMAALLGRADLSFVFKPSSSPPTFPAWNDPRKCYSRVLADLAYKAADAMLAARKGGA